MTHTEKKTLTFIDTIQLRLLLAVCRLLRCAGFKGIYRLGGILGRLTWRLAASRRRYAVSAVQRHLNTGPDEARRIAKASFEHSFRSFLEAVLVKDFPLNEHNRRLAPLPQGFLKLLEEQGPLVLVTAHLGGWELLSSVLGQIRPERRRIVIVREQRNRAANALIQHLRSRSGVEVVGHRNSAATVLRALRENGTTAFLVDHNTRRADAVFLPFLGETAAVNLGPAMLALRAKATLYAMCLQRKPDASYEIHVAGSLDTRDLEGNVTEKCRRIAEFYTRAMEGFILRFPEQWFWMHHRWKTKVEE